MTCKKSRENRGAAAVEFAIIVPLLLIVLFAILEFGFIFLQEHFVANAAREGVRIGIRANNFDEDFTPLGAENDVADESDDTYNTTASCGSRRNRAQWVDCQVRSYLATLYESADVGTLVVRKPATPDGSPATLKVKVQVPNFYPQILSSVIKTLPGGGSFAAPNTISFTATGGYEDLSEP